MDGLLSFADFAPLSQQNCFVHEAVNNLARSKTAARDTKEIQWDFSPLGIS
jgi:hypothetical protein